MHSLRLYVVYALAIVALNAPVHSNVVIDTDTEQENRCGGALEADSGTVTFPVTGQEVVEPGRICIWTIHLQTTTTAQLNFSRLDIIGDEEDCGDNAVRLYSLTNLIPAEKAESYTFCNKNPPTDGNFYLSGSLITVVYRSSEQVSNTGAGFTLNWEGISFQPIPKTHESTYTSASTGIIRYPVDGEYPPNQVNTWLVKTSDTNPNARLQINVPYVNLESCSSSVIDPCLCDTLILYEITATGLLQEDRRLCANSSNSLMADEVGPNFILAFFTDHESSGGGTGFELIYQQQLPSTTTPPPTTTSTSTTPPPTTTPTTTTTTPPPTTTTPVPPPPANISTTCGGILFGNQGEIQYRVDSTYSNFERCHWTVRTPYRSAIRFTIPERYIERYDFLSFYSVNATGVHLEVGISGNSSYPTTILINSSVAIVSLFTDHSYTYQGARISYVAEGPFDSSFNYYTDFNTVATSDTSSLQYPSNGGLYRNLELSTFIVTASTGVTNDKKLNLTFSALHLETGSTGACVDKLYVYGTSRKGWAATLVSLAPMEGGICTLGHLPRLPDQTDSVIMVLATDQQKRLEGFAMEWNTVRDSSLVANDYNNPTRYL